MATFLGRGRPRDLVALFLVVTGLPAVGLVILAWALIAQDRDVAVKQLRDRLDVAAAAIPSELSRDLSALDPRAAHLSPESGALGLVLDEGSVLSHTGAPLLFAPVFTARREPPDRLWATGVDAETRGDYSRAAVVYGRLALSDDPSVRAGALVRLGRSLRLAGRYADAVHAWAEMDGLDEVRALGWPASLQGSLAIVRARDLGQPGGDREQPARRLREDLLRGRWRIDRVMFETAWETAGGGALPLAAADAAALASSAERAFEEWQARPSRGVHADGQRIDDVQGRSILTIWRSEPSRLAILTAGTRFLAERWSPRWSAAGLAVSLEDEHGHTLVATDTISGPVVARTPNETGQPWTIRVASSSTVTGQARVSGRGRLVVLLVSLAVFVFLAGAYFVGRAVRRELAVADLQSGFVSAVSHEFRTPLTSISHLVELLRTRPALDEGRRVRYYEAIEQETTRLRNLVEQLLNFGRADAGAAEYRFEAADAAEVVSDICARFRQTAAARGRTVTCSAVTPLPPVRIDREAFGLALSNLLDNAAKYSPGNEPIEVTLATEVRSRRVFVHVRDHGPGVPVAEQAVIFDKFVRGADVRQSGVRGTGVGLALAREIIRSHSGGISVDSPPAGGSIFSIALPAADRGAPA